MQNTIAVDSLRELLGPERVILDEDALIGHSYDAWPVAVKWRQQGKQPYRPDVVVRPNDIIEISRILAWATEHGVPVTPWGAGSSVTGAPLPLHGGVCLDMSAMRQVLDLDEVSLLVTVQAGKMGHELEAELNARGYTLNHSPQSLHCSTVGGWVATNATGQFSSRWGGIEDLALGLTVVLPTGEIVATKLAPRTAIGPVLRHLFIGSEGTLGVVASVTLKVFPLTAHRRFEACGFSTIEAGLATMRKLMRVGLRPFLVRLYDEDEAHHVMQGQLAAGCILFLGFEGHPAVAEAEYAVGLALCQSEGGECLGPGPVASWMDRRFDFTAIERILEQPGGMAETIEVAHTWRGILPTYRALKQALSLRATEVLGHFSHVYPQGTSLYMIILGNARDAAAAEEALLEIWDAAMRICLETGAVISHHHGVGLARLPFIRRDLASSALLLDRIKLALDPAGIMNPGKLGLPDEF